jgi:hypothetical protein
LPVDHLEPEHGLDLLPDGEDEEQGQEQEQAEQHDETDARAPQLAGVLDAGSALRAGVREGARDRRWVYGRVVCRGTPGSRGADGRRFLPLLPATASCSRGAARP